MRVLIVDDNPTHRTVLSKSLEAEGHQTLEAADGVEALGILRSTQVDAVISDVLMPKMDGYRFSYEVRRSEELREIPIVVYSATYTGPMENDLGTKAGAVHFVQRPAPTGAILEALTDAVRSGKSVKRDRAAEQTEKLKEYSERLLLELEKKNLDLESARDLLSAAAMTRSASRRRDIATSSIRRRSASCRPLRMAGFSP